MTPVHRKPTDEDWDEAFQDKQWREDVLSRLKGIAFLLAAILGALIGQSILMNM